MKYKITIEEIIEKEVPEKSYEKIRTTSTEESEPKVAYGYVDTGRTEIKREEREIYQQEIENLNVPKLVQIINEEKE